MAKNAPLFLLQVVRLSPTRARLAVGRGSPLRACAQALLGVSVNLFTILTVKYTSSISFKLISMAKNALIVLASVPIFHNPITVLQASDTCGGRPPSVRTETNGR